MKKTLIRIALLLAAAALVFVLSNRLSETVRQAFAGDVEFDRILSAWGTGLLAAPFRVSQAQLDLIIGAAVVALLGLVILYQRTKRRDTRPGEEQGSARWAKPREYAALSDADPARRLQLTATEALSLDGRKTQRNLNVCVIGGSGSGKSRHYVIPNLARVDASFAATDPKGELREAVQPELEKRGYKVRTFNLVDLDQSEGFNPLAYFDPEAPETSVVQLVEAIMTNTSTAQAQGNDKFFERAEKALLTALVAYVYGMGADEPDRQPSLVDVADLHKRMSAFEGDKADTLSDVDIQFQALREVVEEWERGEGVTDQTDAIMQCLAFACRQYRVYEQGAGETKKSVIISAGVRLAPLDMSSVRRILSHDTIALDQVGHEKTALFLELPDSSAAFTFFAAMFWSTFFEKNIYEADHQPGRRLPREVHCFLDEFANVGKIPNFERVIATIRSRGISASIIVQSYAQGKAVWRDHWATIVGNCDSLLYLGSTDEETLRWLSGRLGEQTVYTKNVSQSKGAQGSWSEQQQTIKRPLMTKDELEHLSVTEAILIIRALYPIRSPKAPALQR